MTIKDAIDRAKQLRQARLNDRRPSDQQSSYAETAVLQSADRLAEPLPQPTAEVIRKPTPKFEPLRVVELSPEACEANNVLLSDEQLRALPHVDAAYRLLRSRVQQRLKRSNWLSLAVASPNQSDGKTVTTLNVAISVAREKQRPVYVLDLDMRNPSVCRYLGLKDVRSIAEYFEGTAAPEDVLVQTSMPYLFLAGATRPVEGASEMLAGSRFEELLRHIRLRSPGAVVLIDLPPVNVTDEALVIAPRIDAIVIVVSEGKTERKDLERTLSTLSEFPVAGVIVNRSSDSHVAKYDRYTA